jgi:hypothetical protein
MPDLNIDDDDDVTELPPEPRDPKDAREQAADYLGFAKSKIIPVPGGAPIEIPNPGLFDDEQQERWDEVMMDLEQCLRADDFVVPDTTITAKDGTVTVIPGRVVKGDYLQPLRTAEGRWTPNLDTRQAIAVLGVEEFERFKKGGGRAKDIALHLLVMRRQFEERTQRDSKSAVGTVDLAPVPD